MKYYLVFIVLFISPILLSSQTQVQTHAHLEDDYSQSKPLYNALKYNFTSIEVDIHLIDGKLLVSNKHPSPKHKGTLEQLYLSPLNQIITQNGGSVYPNYNGPFYLVLDIKTEAGLTFDVLNAQLAKYESILSKVENNKVKSGPVTVLLAGNRPIPHLWSKKKRLMAIWGNMEDVGNGHPAHFMPVISADFNERSTWNGNGKFENHESNWLVEFCKKVRSEGKKTHFYGYPERQIIWSKLLECGVDMINTKSPKKLTKFFQSPAALVNEIPIVVRQGKAGKVFPNDSLEIPSSPTQQDTLESEQVEPTYSVQTPNILVNGHAHNDYEHERPLYDAVDQGFTSLEVDIHLIEGELYVCHDRPRNPMDSKTLEMLYLESLSQLIEENDRSIYKGYEGDFYLMIDIKTDATLTYAALKEKLVLYKDIFSRVENGELISGPVTVIISGNRPIEEIKAETNRLVFIDGRAGDLELGFSPLLMPLISDNFRKHFQWSGIGDMSELEKNYLKRLVEITHKEGKKLRFWGSPENENTWNLLLESGVDLINTDKLETLAQFLNKELTLKD